jgi:hypothetical protein
MTEEEKLRLEAIENAVFPKPVVPTPEEQAALDEKKRIEDEQNAQVLEQRAKDEAERQAKAEKEKQERLDFDNQTKAIVKEMFKCFGEFAESVVDGVGEFPAKAKMDHFVIQTIPRMMRVAKEVGYKPVYTPYIFKYVLEIFENLKKHYQETEEFQFRTVYEFKVGKGYDQLNFGEVDAILKEWAESIKSKTAEEKKAEGIPAEGQPTAQVEAANDAQVEKEIGNGVVSVEADIK